MAMADSTLPLPTMLNALNEITQSLKDWSIPTTYDPVLHSVNECGDTSPEEMITSVLDGSVPSDRLDYTHSVLPSSSKNLRKTSEMLFFLLEEKYNVNDLGFTDLTGHDQHLARILNCSQLIVIHLAIVTRQPKITPDSGFEKGNVTGKTFKLEHWINATNMLIKVEGVQFDIYSFVFTRRL